MILPITPVPDQLNDESNTETLDTPPVQEPAPAQGQRSKQNPAGKAFHVQRSEQKTVTVIADTAIRFLNVLLKKPSLRRGESVSTDTYTLF